jgi:carboxymethylenebutenolidase
MGFCYGGPYAILGPKRLGYDAGISCHGTRMLDFIGELDGVTAPVCIMCGDQDHAAPAEVLAAYRAVPARMPNAEVQIFPGVLHGYMMPGNAKAFSAPTRAFSMGRALAILEALRGEAGQRTFAPSLITYLTPPSVPCPSRPHAAAPDVAQGGRYRR